jgi:hypothetical protein
MAISSSSRKENYLPKGEREPETAQPLSPRKDPPPRRCGSLSTLAPLKLPRPTHRRIHRLIPHLPP